MSVFVTRRIPELGLQALRDAGVEFEVGIEDDVAPLPRDALLRGVRAHPVVLCQLTDRIDDEVLAANPSLRGVAQMAVGYDNIDVAAARARGIPVGNTPGVLTDATADLTWALLLAVARRVPQAHRYTVDGRFRAWGPNLLLGASVGPAPDGTRRTLGIVGLGRIGQAVARRARGFDMEVLTWSRTPRAIDGVAPVAFDELLERSDFVTLHVPLDASTRHLVGADALRRMKSTAFLINTARGPIVDEAALVRALRERVIAGAGLDVYEREPRLEPGLVDLPNVVLLPHVGSATHETRARMAEMAATNAICFVRGTAAPHLVG